MSELSLHYRCQIALVVLIIFDAPMLHATAVHIFYIEYFNSIVLTDVS